MNKKLLLLVVIGLLVLGSFVVAVCEESVFDFGFNGIFDFSGDTTPDGGCGGGGGQGGAPG